jgi:DNA-binding transcriptional MocR family regulator
MKIKQKLYQKIAQEIASLVTEGTLVGGAKIPSVRALKEKMQVSISTVTKAYSILEAQGLIEAKPKSGYFVRHGSHIESLPQSPLLSKAPTPLHVMDFINLVLHPDHNIQGASFSIASPSPKLLPAKALNRELSISAKLAAEKGLDYSELAGSLSLRKQLSMRSLSWGKRLKAEDFIITTGAIDALSLALRAVTKPGDKIAVEAPTYFGILQLLEILQLKVIEVPVRANEGPDLEILLQIIKSHTIATFITIPNFQNPLGSLMSDEKKKRLVEIAAKHTLSIIEDDIYSDLHFDGPRPKTLKSFDKHGLVLLCSSISKTLAPGYRVGWISPGKYLKKVEALKIALSGKTPTLNQLAVARFMASGAYDRHLKKIRKIFKQSVGKMSEAILKYFPPGTKISQPKGGFIVWVELNPKINTLALQQEALKHNISIAPGPLFSARKEFNHYIRMSCGYEWTLENEKAIKRLGSLIVS